MDKGAQGRGKEGSEEGSGRIWGSEGKSLRTSSGPVENGN